MPTIREFRAGEWQRYRALRLRALAQAPEAFGGTLADAEARPGEVWIERFDAGIATPTNLPLIAESSGEDAGLAWGRIEVDVPETAHVYQLWVDPAARGRGLGEQLVRRIVQWARESNAREVVLKARAGDTPANRLYARVGFERDPANDDPGYPAWRLAL